MSGNVLMYRGPRPGSGARRTAFAGVLLLAGVAATGCGAKVEKAAEGSDVVRSMSITATEMERRIVVRTVDAIGTLRGWEEVTVGAKRPGRILKILKDMGDTVAPGQPLLEMETTDSELAIDQAQKKLLADLSKLGLDAMPKSEGFDPQTVPAVVQSRVAQERAERNLAREKTLITRGAGTLMDLQNTQNDVDAAKASLENAIVTARSTLASAQASLSALEQAKQAKVDMLVKAPVPTNLPKEALSNPAEPVVYAVTKRPVHEGQMVKEGEALYDLVIQRPLRLWANVPERFTSEVKLGQEVRLTVASQPKETFSGTVARINPSIDTASRTFQVEALVPNHRGLLRPGGFAKASIVTKTDAQAVVVPIESVVKYAGVTKIFVVEGGKARAIPVETGLEGKDWVEVKGDLPTRGQVVTSGQTMLADGTPVTVRTEEKAKAGEETPKAGEEKPKAGD